MADFTICVNKDCVMKDKCYRATAKYNEFMQAVNKFKPIVNEKKDFYCLNYLK